MEPRDTDFEAWLRRQDDAEMDGDLVIYGTTSMTAIMTRRVTLCPKLGSGDITETVIINAYPEVKLVTVTYPRLDVGDSAHFPGVVQEKPVRTPTPEHPFPIGDRFQAEVKRHVEEGWTAVSEAERQ